MSTVPKRVPDIVIRRISIYSRILSAIVDKGTELVSSDKLGELSGISGTLVRKDLAYFGQFGTRGVGYHVSDLRSTISKILGIDKRWKVAIVGIGNLGAALLSHERFSIRGFDIILGFDADKSKIGQIIHGIEIKDITEVKSVIKEKDVKLGIITVPANSAQVVANMLIDAGIKAILNFAPVNLNIPKDIVLKNIDLSIELDGLSFLLTHKDFQVERYL